MDYLKDTIEKMLAGFICILSVLGMAVGINRITRRSNIGIIGGKDGPTAVYYSDERPVYSVLKFMASAAFAASVIITGLLALIKAYSNNQ